MRAVQVIETTGPAGCRLAEIEEPVAPEGGVLVEVRSAGLSFPDLLLTLGLYQERPPLPFTLGVEAAGVVREAAPGSGFGPGDRVCAFGQGSCAELMAVSASTICRMPEGLSFDEGSGLVLNYHTAHFALLRRGRLRAGETLLVHGAAGGVGTAAVQVGKGYGARVIAVVSTETKAALARRAGADEVVMVEPDWRSEVMELTGGRGADVIFDPVGGERFKQSLRAIAPEGRLVVIGFAEGAIPEVGANRILFKNADVVGAAWGAFLRHHPEITTEIAADLERLVAAGTVRPLVTSTYPLEEFAAGLAEIGERRVLGKVALHVSG